MSANKFFQSVPALSRFAVKFILLNSILLVLMPDARAGNFTVSNTTQFQTALNTAASNGQNDTINVLAGTYNVNPTLTYTSNENYFILIKGVGSPVLDGGNARRVLLISTTSGNADIFVEGLTIQHGQADYGGGLNAGTEGADISIKNCSVNYNSAGYVSGGINLFSNTGNVSVTGCSFTGNSSPNTSGYPYGNAGGLFIQTDGSGTVITMSGCTFQLNTAQRDAAGAMLYPLGPNSTVIAESNTFTNNTAKEAGGGCWIRGPGGNTTVRYRYNTLTGNISQTAGSGGGTYIQITSGIIDVSDNVHTGNHSIWQGGGLWIEHSGGTLYLYRNKFTNNTSVESGGGANVFLDYGTMKIDHNIFHKNSTSGPGGGLNLSTNSASLHIFNNTFFLNSAADGGDVNTYFDNSSSSANFYNNILYKSSAPAISYSGQQSLLARYCDIQGGFGQPWFGTGCIDIYPFFSDTASGNLHLQDSIHCGSPRYSRCIDAGIPSAQDSVINCNWGLGLIRSDMGAYGGKYSPTIGINSLQSIVPGRFNLYQNYPNPFNPLTKIKFDIPNPAFISLKVYDIEGREISVLAGETVLPGVYEVTFDGSGLSSGVYFYRLSSKHFNETKKMILLK